MVEGRLIRIEVFPRRLARRMSYSRKLKALSDSRQDNEADTIRDFCRKHRLGVATYYKLPTELRPLEMRLGKKVLISREAAAEWRARMETRTAEGAI